MVQYKKFCLNELFTFETGDVDLQQKDINGKGCFFINSGLSNTGIKGKTDRKAKVFPPNTITVDFWGNAFYRDFEYKLATHNHVFSLSGDVIRNREVGLYLVSQMAYFRKLFSFNEMATIKKLKKLSIELPIDSNGDFDWVYMESFIKDIEQRYIEELEQKAVILPNQYLAASGLDEYELSDEDEQVLVYQPMFKDFCIGDLFERLKAPYVGEGRNRDNISKVRTDEFSLPLINCKDGNNGIMYYGRYKDFTHYQGVLSVIYNGPPTEGQTYYQPEIGVLSDAYLIRLKNKEAITELVGLYLVSAINKSIHDLKNKKYSRGNKATWNNKVENDVIKLPVTSNGEPDWNYMESYIKAIEKLAIKSLVDKQEQFVAKTKDLVDCVQ